MNDTLPLPTENDEKRLVRIFHFIRLHLPTIRLTKSEFREEIGRTFTLYRSKADRTTGWSEYLDRFYALDWCICIGCLTNSSEAWDSLFSCRSGQNNLLLADSLRKKAAHFYGRNAEERETAVADFWGHLIVRDRESDKSTSILGRYDGRRPLIPWLTTTFKNRLIDSFGGKKPAALSANLPCRNAIDEQFYAEFSDAARQWIDSIANSDRILIGLIWWHRLTQRQTAKLLGVHEATISRRLDAIFQNASDAINSRLSAFGWTDLSFPDFHSELISLLNDISSISLNEIAELKRESSGMKKDRSTRSDGLISADFNRNKDFAEIFFSGIGKQGSFRS